jgi:hypothetical protein
MKKIILFVCIVLLLFFIIIKEIIEHGSWKKYEEYPIYPILDGDTLVIGLKTNPDVKYAFIKNQGCICPREKDVEKTKIIKRDTTPTFITYIRRKEKFPYLHERKYEVKYELIVPHKVKLVEMSDFYLDSIISTIVSLKREKMKEKKIKNAIEAINRED